MNSEKRLSESRQEFLNDKIAQLETDKQRLTEEISKFRQATLNETENFELLEKKLREDVKHWKRQMKTAQDDKRKAEQ